MGDPYSKNRFALRIFDGIAARYEGPANAFSMFQYARWRRSLVSGLRLAPGASVLDVCTGTAGVAMHITRSMGCRVVGVDLSQQMLRHALDRVSGAGLGGEVRLVRGRAEGLPFRDGAFDAVVFTFLLRYLDDAQATLDELSRVLRPGGRMASLEFYVPQNPVLRTLWLLHTRVVLPVGTRFLSPGWRQVGSFLGPSISEFYAEHTLDGLDRMWERAGIRNLRREVFSFGGAVATWGQKETASES